MTYYLTIYANTQVLNRQRNNVFDDIEEYLASFCTKVYEANNIQIQQIEFNKTLRIDKPEIFAQLNEFNYCYVSLDVLNENGQVDCTYYYFIDDVKRRGSQTIELSLTLDTVQTFYNEIFNSLSPRTRVLREHTNRFLGKEYRDDVNKLPWATIDRNSEGLNPPLYRLSRGSEILPDTRLEAAGAWFLVYQTANDITADTRQPVAAYLMPENSIKVSKKNALPSGYHLETFKQAETTTGKDYQYILLDDRDANGGAYFSIYPSAKVGGTRSDGSNIRALQLDTSKNIYAFAEYELSTGGTQIKRVQVYTGTTEQDVKVVNGVGVRKATKLLDAGDFANNYGPLYDYPLVLLESENSVFNLAPFSTLKRTDTRLMKIIKLPYFPLTAKYDANDNLIIDNATLEDGKIRVNDFEDQFFNENIKGEASYVYGRRAFYSPVNTKNVTTFGGRQYLAWNAVQDPKIFNSEFYQEKIQYDNYSYLYKLEDFDITDPLKQLDKYRLACEISYKQSSIMASRMVFWFDWGQIAKKNGLTNFEPRTTQDYGEFLFVERSNEMPIYNNAYIDYINNGYNYDRKNLDEQKASRWVNFGANILTGTAQTAVGLATGNAFSITKAVGEVGGTFSTIYNNIIAQASAERGLEQKQNDLRRQASTVSACDDMSLFQLYGRNLLLSFRYGCSNEVLDNVKKLFHFYGYASARTGKPNIDNRYWFNFVQCTPDFILNGSYTNTMFLNYADDIIQRLGEGLTIYHVRTENGVPVVNLEQDKLNIETEYAGMD